VGSIQEWKLVQEGSAGGGEGPRNSFAGSFLQVLPDESRHYPARGHDLVSIERNLDNGQAPSVNFAIRPSEDGDHTLFLRWTGGDDVGGGDSMFVSMYDGNMYVSGRYSVKPTYLNIGSSFGPKWAGCCRNEETHGCECRLDTNDYCSQWVDKDRAERMNTMCPTGAGAMTIVAEPKWYLFAGQEAGNVMDFDSEPWDVTCEAEGNNVRDSGRSFSVWNLKANHDYEIRIFAREDGTALDAIYLTGPSVKETPNGELRFKAGDSTECGGGNDNAWWTPMRTFLVTSFLLSVVALGGMMVVTRTEVGSEIYDSVRMKFQSLSSSASRGGRMGQLSSTMPTAVIAEGDLTLRYEPVQLPS